ncbi:major capsid protein [Gokushovirinae sp.]|nr:major capsid protein [Gokushovirinae sp.]
MNYGLDSADSGSNYQFGDKMLKPSMARSGFDWSCLNSLTIPNCGMLIPIFFDEVLPSSSYDIQVQALLRVLPQVVPLYSRQRLYIHAFGARYSDLFKDASVYITKGFNGNNILKKPVLKADMLDPVLFPDGMDTVIKAGSLFDYLDLPIGKKLSELGEINALPFMMYVSIWKYYFMNKNLYINNRYWLPNDDADFRLTLNNGVASNTTGVDGSAEGEPKVYFGSVLYRDYPQDYFLSALPFAQRGETPRLNVSGKDPFIPLQIANFPDSRAFAYISSAVDNPSAGFKTVPAPSADTESYLRVSASSTDVSNSLTFLFGNKGGSKVPLSNRLGIYAQLGFTLDDFRQLAIAQQELERMARTDGSFFEFGLTFFGRASKNALDYRPQYIGGTYQNITFSEVLQTSSSTDVSPLGSYGGHGITSLNGSLGHYETDEHGYIMILASIMPDVYYSQGLDKKWTRLTQSEEFITGRDKMGLIPILNKELFVSGNTAKDNDLFAYQNPFDEYRYKPSRIHGKIADPASKSFFPYTQSRKFDSTPTYSRSFFKADDVRKDYLTAPTEDAYSAQFKFSIRAVEPLSYNGSPAPIV